MDLNPPLWIHGPSGTVFEIVVPNVPFHVLNRASLLHVGDSATREALPSGGRAELPICVPV